MNTTPIICSGNELDGVLDGIRKSGGFIASLETRIGKHNADYRINYFGGVAELDRRSLVTGRVIPEAASSAAIEGSTHSATNNLTEKPIRFRPGPQNPCKATVHDPSQTVAGPVVAMENTVSSISYFDRVTTGMAAAALQDGMRILEPLAVSSAIPTRVPVNPFPHQGETPANPAAPEAAPLPHCPTCSGPVTQDMACPICAGLERIREGARKLRNRFTSSTREARKPHAD